MSEWIVYSKDGNTERCRLKALEYVGTWMGERAVTATFEYHSEVAFEVFDYLEYRGEVFELDAVPTVKKTSSFDYSYDLRFVSKKYELERCEMRDLVPNDNGVVYPTPLTFSFTGDVRYLVERIQACLDALYGEGVWSIVVADGVESEEKNITLAQQNCWNALALVNTTYGLNFYVKGREVVIGGTQPVVSHTFEYGKGNGLYEIERSADTDKGIVTKLRAYGGTRNLDYSYPKQPEWNDSALSVSFALSPLRLMLPSFKADGKTDFVLADDATIAKYGIREASMVYDDIYPTITGATNSSGEAIDEIKSVDAVDDSASTFTVYLYDLGFDLEEHLTTSEAQLSMKSGPLQGYTFNISSIEKQSDGGYKLVLGRNSLEGSEESGFYVPNADWNMSAGDKFVLLNILMPQAYIREAEERLLARAKEYLAQYGKTNFSYNIGLHDKFLVEHGSVYGSLLEGSKLSVRDAEIGIDEDVTIQSITITENMEENILPQVKVTLNNEPSASTLDRIQGKLNDIANETAANNFSSQSELMAQYRKKLDKPFFDKLFVAIDADGNEIASNDVTTPVAYIKALYDVAVVGGVTMYVNDKSLDIPSIYAGLPIDTSTLRWIETTDSDGTVTRLLGINPDIDLGGGAATWDELEGKPSWIGNTKPSYNYSEILQTPDLSVYALASDLEKYVTLGGDETITGLKNFTKGIQIDGLGIAKSQDDVIYLDANLVVRGGITMYAEGTVDVGTIFDALPIDDSTIYWEGGVLKANITEGVITNITSAMVVEALGYTPYNASNPNGYISGITSDMVTTALGYTPLQNHQTIYALTIQKNGTTVGTYTPNSAKKTINIVVPTKVSELTNDSEYATTSDLDTRISDLINGAPAAYDTLKEIAEVLEGNINSIGDIITTLGTKADKATKISAGTGLSGGGTLEADRTLSLATSGVSAGAYKSVTVDKYGRVTSGTNPTTLAGYGITDAYTKTNVDDLLKLYVTLATAQTITGEKDFTGGLKVNGSPIVYDATNKYWKLEGDLLVTGGVTMYGSDSEFTPSTIMDGVVVDNVTIKKNSDGALYFAGSIDGGIASSVDWANVENKPSFATVATSGKYADLSGTPTLLSSFTDDVVAGKYLPLNGGTLSNSYEPLIVKRLSDTGASFIRYHNNEGLIGTIGIGGSASSFPYDIYFQHKSGSSYKIWHSGNFNPSDYLLASNYTASDILAKLKTVDGEGSGLESEMTYLFKTVWSSNSSTTIDLNEWINGGLIWAYGHTSNVLNKPDGVTYSAAIEFGRKGFNSLIGQFLWNVNHNSETDTTKNLYFRASDTNGFLHSQWHTIAFTDSNVASATKLQTARTIWGQSFDGTGDISGHLTLNDGKIYGCTSGSILHQASETKNVLVGYDTAEQGYNTYINGNVVELRYGTNRTNGLIINSTGNVLIGTTTDSGYKLNVNGKVHSSLAFDLPYSTGEGSGITFAGRTVLRVSSGGTVLSAPYGETQAIWIRPRSTGDSSYSSSFDGNGGFNLAKKLTLDGIPIYKSQDDVLYIDGNLAVRGGITMYATDAIDVDDIIANLPIASTSEKGIASFNPNDFSVVDGYVSFIGSGGVDESVLADYAKKTDLNSYLPLSGGQMTGNIWYNSDMGGNIPYAGALSTSLLFNQGAFTPFKSFIGNVNYTPDNSWYNVISVRADNGHSNYGMYIVTSMVDQTANLLWNRQGGYNGAWQGERVILDSVNWSNYISVTGSQTFNGTLLINGSNALESYPALKFHISNVDWAQFYMASDGKVYLTSGSAQNSDYRDLYAGNMVANNLAIRNTSSSSVKGLSLYGNEGFVASYGILFTGTSTFGGQFGDVLTGDWATYFTMDGGSYTQGANVRGWIFRHAAGGNVASIGADGNIQSTAWYRTIGNGGWYSETWGGGLYMADNYWVRIYGGKAFYCESEILAGSGITMYSDIRKKTKLQDVELSLKQIADAPLIEHYYNSDDKKTTHVGSIAQYWAGLNDWFCKLDNEGFYTMEIQNAALASAISIARHLQKYETKTDRTIRKLKQRVSELEEKIEELEKKGA